MSDKVTQYVNSVFAPYSGVKSVDELKSDLLTDLHDRFKELKNAGKDEETAFNLTVASIGDIEQTVQEVANVSRSLDRQVLTNLSASNLENSDFEGVTAHKGKFFASDLKGSDFSGADMTGSSFKASDVSKTNFDHANLTDCRFSVLDLSHSTFEKSIMIRTIFNKSDLSRSSFKDVTMDEVELLMTDLAKTRFENCTFNGVIFKYCDLDGLKLDGQTFLNVRFDKASLKGVSFTGATLSNVSFTPKFSLTNKYYRAIKSICFDGAMMDKLTYASLKSLDADLSKVTVI